MALVNSTTNTKNLCKRQDRQSLVYVDAFYIQPGNGSSGLILSNPERARTVSAKRQMNTMRQINLSRLAN